MMIEMTATMTERDALLAAMTLMAAKRSRELDAEAEALDASDPIDPTGDIEMGAFDGLTVAVRAGQVGAITMREVGALAVLADQTASADWRSAAALEVTEADAPRCEHCGGEFELVDRSFHTNMECVGGNDRFDRN